MKKNLVYHAGVEVNDSIYFSAHRTNGIFKQDKKSGKVICLGVVPESGKSALHCKAVLHKNQIFFIPSWGDCITKLNLDDYSISAVAIPPSANNCSTAKFIDVVVNGKDAWLVPIGYDALLCLDMESGEVTSYTNWPEGVQWKHDKYLMFRAGVQVSDLLCLCPAEGEFFVTFNLKTKEMKAWEWKYPAKAFGGMIYHREYVWFLPGKEYPYVVKHSLCSGETVKTKVEGIADSSWYAKSVLIGDTIVCTPYEAKQWLFVNTVTDEVIPLPFTDSRTDAEYPYYQFATVLKDGVKFFGDKQVGGHFISVESLEISETFFCEIEELDLFISTVFHQNKTGEKSEEKRGKQIFEVL